jgi:adenylate kinase
MDTTPDALRRICLVGVRGVGKTSLIRSVLDRLPKVDYLIGSAILRELAGVEFAHFDFLSPERKQYHRERAIHFMVQRQTEAGRHILCDGHTSLFNPVTSQVEPVFTALDCQFFRELILFEATPELVLERRSQDPSKKRCLDLQIIREELSVERDTCLRVAREHGMVMHRLMGTGDPATGRQLLQILAG